MPFLMKTVYIFLVGIVAISCQLKVEQVDKLNEWTEEQNRRDFIDSFSRLDGFGLYEAGDTVQTFANFFKSRYPNVKARNAYDAFPYALEEEYIDTTTIDTTRHWFRIIVRPCFRNPYCLTVEKKFGKTFLTTKITDGSGGYETGNLVITMKFPFGDSLYDNLVKELVELDFWSLPLRDTSCGGGLDGEVWTFESIEKGKYNLLGRWSPEGCGNNTTKQLAQLGLRIRNLSELDRVLGAFNQEKNGM
jgi:hypothetical protein